MSQASFVDRQRMWWSVVLKKRDVKREEREKERKEAEMKELRDSPTITKLAKQLQRSGGDVVQFQREWAEQQKRHIEAKRTQAEAEEMVGATFTPKLNARSEKLARRRPRPANNIEVALIQQGTIDAENRQRVQQECMLKGLTGTPQITRRARDLQREDDVCERLYRLDESKRRSHEEARIVKHAEAISMATPATNTSGYERSRALPIEDDILLRDAHRRNLINQKMTILEELNRKARKPMINKNSERIAREKRELEKELHALYGDKAQFERVRKKYVPEQPTFTPTINKVSKDMEKARFTSTEEHIEWLHMSRELAGPQEHVPTASELEDLAESTFKPKITTPPVPLPQGDVVDRLYSWKHAKEERLYEAQVNKVVEEPSYSFTPAINREVPKPEPAQEIVGIDSYVERQRKARAMRAAKEQDMGPNRRWKPRVTRPKEFHFHTRPRVRITALERPSDGGKARRIRRSSRSQSELSMTDTADTTEPDQSPGLGTLKVAPPSLDLPPPPEPVEVMSPDVITDYSVILSRVEPTSEPATPDHAQMRADRDKTMTGIREAVRRPWRDSAMKASA
ncbi:hypothetical protein J8273_1664 [Carpediemonas membranifera]|uniref:Uncharacterized protein n=1 Tax=Carpediemonas membranifera TaxID=201153 RepID=A0A8J6BB77_9EUKA|nr:hypothetical protein J8273_1664 [Carpediemonas membranifera]|eukprot:KAG9396647.1 hypothetical protein J8273_1664 [Carpediemonas membranifera]